MDEKQKELAKARAKRYRQNKKRDDISVTRDERDENVTNVTHHACITIDTLTTLLKPILKRLDALEQNPTTEPKPKSEHTITPRKANSDNNGILCKQHKRMRINGVFPCGCPS